MQIGGVSVSLADHPTVKAYREGKISSPKPPAILESTQLKKIALTAGTDDAGLVDLSRDAMTPTHLAFSSPEIDSMTIFMLV
jgi:hypothetical protein